jgi:hypothetical protein
MVRDRVARRLSVDDPCGSPTLVGTEGMRPKRGREVLIPLHRWERATINIARLGSPFRGPGTPLVLGEAVRGDPASKSSPRAAPPEVSIWNLAVESVPRRARGDPEAAVRAGAAGGHENGVARSPTPGGARPERKSPLVAGRRGRDAERPRDGSEADGAPPRGTPRRRRRRPCRSGRGSRGGRASPARADRGGGGAACSGPRRRRARPERPERIDHRLHEIGLAGRLLSPGIRSR